MLSKFDKFSWVFFSVTIIYIVLGFSEFLSTSLLIILFFLSTIYPLRTEVAANFVLVALLLSLFNWIIVSANGFLWQIDSRIFASLPKAFSVPIMLLLMLTNLKINKLSYLFLFLLLLILILKALVFATDKNVAANYLINTFIPFIVLMLFVIFKLKSPINAEFYRHLIVAIFLIIVLNSTYILLELSGFYESIEVFSFSGELFRPERDAWYGNYITTFIDGSRIHRYPGLFADPIVAGHFWSGLFSFTLVIRNKVTLIIRFFSLVFVLITLSKGALIITFFSYFLYKLLKTKRTKYNLFTSLISSIAILVLLIFTSLRNNNVDSSAMHVLGLYLPFIGNLDMVYILGADLGTAGNLGGWVTQGAESFIGLIKYSLGLLGVALVLVLFYLAIVKHTSFTTKYSKFVLIAITPIFITSFLQENTFNISYVFPKIILLLGVASYQVNELPILKDKIEAKGLNHIENYN